MSLLFWRVETLLRRIVYPIISKLGRHFFFFHSFNVLAAPDTRREILLDVLSLSFFQTAAQMVSAGSEPALKDSCKVFFLKCKSLISDEWTEEINPILRSVSCVRFLSSSPVFACGWRCHGSLLTSAWYESHRTARNKNKLSLKDALEIFIGGDKRGNCCRTR